MENISAVLKPKPPHVRKFSVHALSLLQPQTRLWIQGVAVQIVPPDESTLLIDDGSGIIPVYAAAVLKQRQHSAGLTAYLGGFMMVVGVLMVDAKQSRFVMAHQLVDLRSCPDRESLWHLELVHEGQQKQKADKKRCELIERSEAQKKRKIADQERAAERGGANASDGYDSEEVRHSEYAMMKGGSW